MYCIHEHAGLGRIFAARQARDVNAARETLNRTCGPRALNEGLIWKKRVSLARIEVRIAARHVQENIDNNFAGDESSVIRCHRRFRGLIIRVLICPPVSALYIYLSIYTHV